MAVGIEAVTAASRVKHGRHAQVVVSVPTGLHDSFLRMPVRALHDMRDLVNQHMGQQIRQQIGAYVSDSVVKDFDLRRPERPGSG
jgi:hypothetical protein